MKQEIRKLLDSGKVIIGTDRTLKALRSEKLSRVLISANCNESTVEQISAYAGKAKVEKLPETNEELGVLCKKPFRIAVLGIM